MTDLTSPDPATDRDDLDTAAIVAGRSPVLRFAERLLGVMVAILLMAMMFVTAIDVFGRYLLSRPLPGAFELTEIMLAMIVFIAMPLVCLHRENITVTLITDRLSSRARNLHHAVVSLACGIILAIVSWRLMEHALQLASFGDVTVFLRAPKGPIGYTMSAFTALAALAMLIVTVEHVRLYQRLRRARRAEGAANRDA